MGALQAQAIADDVKDGNLNLEIALQFHFRSNHYPPLPLSLIPIAVKIIKGEVTDRVTLPDGITYKGSKTAPVQACIKAWHLDSFLLNPDDYEEV